MANSTHVEDEIRIVDDGSPRPTGTIIQDVIQHVEEIVRSEIRLAKVELKQEATKAAKGAVLLGVGAVFGLFTLACILGVCVAALTIVIPVWAALLVIAFLCLIVTGAALGAGLTRIKQVRPLPVRTVQTLRDDVSWLKSQT